MIDFNEFRGNPFYLTEDDIVWVKSALESMDESDKIGQLFFLIAYAPDAEYAYKVGHQIKAGGVMCRAMHKIDLISCVSMLQKESKIPLLIAANLEAGANGICKEATKIGSEMMIAATGDVVYAKALGAVCAEEGISLGANYSFAPVTDIDYNFRNPITNTRTFGSDLKTVSDFSSAYLKECQARGMACSVKHFPGDGRDERDQHLCTTVNDFNTEEWDLTYGAIYKRLISEGAKSFMIGHIMQPAYSKSLNPDLKDDEIMPATLSKELLTGLLREKLGFKGLIITDATTMAGFDAAMPRSSAVPAAIAAGCDMFLFTKNLDEDYEFMKRGVQSGIISAERLDDAVARILALKASLKLHKKNNVPSMESADIVGCEAHRIIAKEVADKCITLVKNKQAILPLDKNKIHNILIYDIESGDNAIGYAHLSGVYEKIAPLLEKEGFRITRFVPTPGLEGRTERYSEIKKYDLLLYLCNLATKSNQTTVRIEWINPMGVNVPRYVETVPTIFVSFENPYHLLDVPMVKTYINTYGMNDYTISSLVEKLMGRSRFKGIAPVDAFCGKWDAKR